MIYLLLGRIDSRLWNNQLVHVLEIDQSIEPSSQDSQGYLGSGFLDVFALPCWRRSQYQPAKKAGQLTRIMSLRKKNSKSESGSD
jgi:hypothetical protein